MNRIASAANAIRQYFHGKAVGYAAAFFTLCIIVICTVPAYELHDLTFSSPAILTVFFLGYLFGGGELLSTVLSSFRRKEETDEQQVQSNAKSQRPGG